MATLIEGQVGPQTAFDGMETPPRLGKSAEQIVTELHGRYYEQVYRGNVFFAAAQAVQSPITARAIQSLLESMRRKKQGPQGTQQ